MDFKVRNYRSKDWTSVRAIYRAGIETGIATFETEVKSQEEFEASSITGCTIVAVNAANGVHGWACLWPVSDRCCYSGVAEVSVYIAPNQNRKGLGALLLDELIKRSELKGIWTLQSGVFEANTASIKLHQKCGFRIVGTRERLGQVNGQWHNIVMMEKRSSRVN